MRIASVAALLGAVGSPRVDLVLNGRCPDHERANWSLDGSQLVEFACRKTTELACSNPYGCAADGDDQGARVTPRLAPVAVPQTCSESDWNARSSGWYLPLSRAECGGSLLWWNRRGSIDTLRF